MKKLKLKPIKLNRNSAKNGKKHSFVLSLISLIVVLAFLVRTFPNEVANLVGLESGMLKKYSDHAIGFGIAGLFMYLGFIMIMHPFIGILLGVVGAIVAYFEYLKLTGKEQ